MASRVKIHVDADGQIEKVEDRWNDKLPDGPVSEVSLASSSPTASSSSLPGPPPRLRALVRTAGLWGWWAFAHASWWWPFLVRAPVFSPCTPARAEETNEPRTGFPQVERRHRSRLCQGPHVGRRGHEDAEGEGAVLVGHGKQRIPSPEDILPILPAAICLANVTLGMVRQTVNVPWGGTRSKAVYTEQLSRLRRLSYHDNLLSSIPCILRQPASQPRVPPRRHERLGYSPVTPPRPASIPARRVGRGFRRDGPGAFQKYLRNWSCANLPR